MENQAKTNTEQKEQQLKKLSKMSLIRSLLPVVGLVVIFLLFNVLTNFRMVGNLSLVLSQVYVTMIAATGVFFIMTITLNKKNYMDTTQIAALAARGHEIGLHSMDHTMATKYKTDTDLKCNLFSKNNLI